MSKKLKDDNDFVRLIKQASKEYQVWQVWDDVIYMCAVELAQLVDYRQDREEEYIRKGKRYDKETIKLFPEIFAAIMNSLVNTDGTANFSDVLGDAYMRLEINNHWHGQFFTPQHICYMMAAMSINWNGIEETIATQGYVTINDPCCGAGGMLIAAADVMQKYKINYKREALFVGQDIDPVCALMTYVQMSLLGMPGIIQIGNSLTTEYRDTWYTPQITLLNAKHIPAL